MENIGQKKKPCEEKKIFAPKIGFGKCIQKTWLSLIIVEFQSSRYNKKCLTKKNAE